MRISLKAILSIMIAFTFSCGESSKKPENEEGFITKTDTIKKAETSETSIITCPNCGFQKSEILPTEVCLLAYTCEKCKTVLHPKDGDCCVFCTYGDHKCPSKQ